MRRTPKLWNTFWLVFLMLIAAGVFSASAAANTVSPTGLTDQSSAIQPNDLKPSECSAIFIARLVEAGTGKTRGGGTSDLILGWETADTISARPGSDCILGGAGDDTINGNQGNDVILGGDGNDTIDGGPGTDTCYGGAGINTFDNCEAIIQD